MTKIIKPNTNFSKNNINETHNHSQFLNLFLETAHTRNTNKNNARKPELTAGGKSEPSSPNCEQPPHGESGTRTRPGPSDAASRDQNRTPTCSNTHENENIAKPVLSDRVSMPNQGRKDVSDKSTHTHMDTAAHIQFIIYIIIYGRLLRQRRIGPS